MKATGIVRRIDELSRVVIPKEIRRTLRIREGDALEIYTDREGGVILKKYSRKGSTPKLLSAEPKNTGLSRPVRTFCRSKSKDAPSSSSI